MQDNPRVPTTPLFRALCCVQENFLDQQRLFPRGRQFQRPRKTQKKRQYVHYTGAARVIRYHRARNMFADTLLVPLSVRLTLLKVQIHDETPTTFSLQILSDHPLIFATPVCVRLSSRGSSHCIKAQNKCDHERNHWRHALSELGLTV